MDAEEYDRNSNAPQDVEHVLVLSWKEAEYLALHFQTARTSTIAAAAPPTFSEIAVTAAAAAAAALVAVAVEVPAATRHNNDENDNELVEDHRGAWPAAAMLSNLHDGGPAPLVPSPPSRSLSPLSPSTPWSSPVQQHLEDPARQGAGVGGDGGYRSPPPWKRKVILSGI